MAQHSLVRDALRAGLSPVHHEVTDTGILVITHRLVNRTGQPRGQAGLTDPHDIKTELVGDFLIGRLAPEFLGQPLLHTIQLGQRLGNVHRQTDRPTLVRNRPGDRLTDPPRRIGRELVATAPVELLDGAHQADVAFLDQIDQRQASPDVPLGDADNQTQVAERELLPGGLVT